MKEIEHLCNKKGEQQAQQGVNKVSSQMLNLQTNMVKVSFHSKSEDL